jgi:hypothetical protein
MTQREFKLRVWEYPRPADDFKGAMTYIDWTQDYDVRFLRYCLCPENKDVYAVMQFSGLRDKNGSEIYEGGVLETEHRRCEVKWDIQTAAFRFAFDKGNWESPLNYGDVKVIGNVHENPGLLKV